MQNFALKKKTKKKPTGKSLEIEAFYHTKNLWKPHIW